MNEYIFNIKKKNDEKKTSDKQQVGATPFNFSRLSFGSGYASVCLERGIYEGKRIQRSLSCWTEGLGRRRKDGDRLRVPFDVSLAEDPSWPAPAVPCCFRHVSPATPSIVGLMIRAADEPLPFDSEGSMMACATKDTVQVWKGVGEEEGVPVLVYMHQFTEAKVSRIIHALEVSSFNFSLCYVTAFAPHVQGGRLLACCCGFKLLVDCTAVLRF